MKFISTLIGWAIGLPFALGSIVFAATNRQTVSVDLWPFPASLDLPLSLLVLGATLSGLLLGSLAVWISVFPLKRRFRIEQKRANRLEAELLELRRDVGTGAPSVLPTFTPPGL